MHASGIAWTASLHALVAALAWLGLSGPVTTEPVPIQVRFVELAPEQPAPEPPKVAEFVPPPPAPVVPEKVPEKPVVEKVPEKKPEKKPVRKKVDPPVAKKPEVAPKKVEPAAQAQAQAPAPAEDVAQTESEPSPAPIPAPVAAQPRPDPAPAPVLASAAPSAPVIAPRFDAAYLRNPAPAYPRASRRLGEQGRVILRVCVEPDGRPSALEVHQSSGSARLDEAALKAVQQWSFVAARRGNENVTAWVLVPMDFRLKNS